MAFDLHPILSPGQPPTLGLWYAISPEDCGGPSPAAKVGACANFELIEGGAAGGRVLLSAGATPEGPYSDLHQLIIRKDCLKWEELPGGDLPARYEHTSFLVGGARESTLYVFAGANQNGSLSDMWKHQKEHWTLVDTNGPVPSPRTLHSNSCCWNKTLIVFGGGAAGTSPISDTAIHLFQPDTNEWSSPCTSGTPPTPRQGHISVVVENKLLVHGGMAGQDILSDLHILDLDKWAWSCPKVKGDPPPRLAAHGCAVIGRKVFVFGGMNPTTGASDHLYCLNTDTLEWRGVSVNGPPPPARLDHAMCSVLIPVASGGTAAVASTAATMKASLNKTATATHPTTSQPTAINTITLISPDSVEERDFSLVTQPKPPTVSECGTDTSSTTDKSMATTTTKDSTDANTLSDTLRKSKIDPPTSGSLPQESFDLIRSSSVVENNVEWVPGLFVFGGMDTSGHIHGDCFVLCPHRE
ncbi:rab9 effector protein with kelch motifs-like isoform X2 [Halichondria panicea]|uniref:rab9 effector protein with kelch motifs-like isoform X2 n=1 Tax=Halichondria panicea TaxID=6063 RepID=UPI00312BB147